jgi:gliding motility-associated-like protein
MDGGSTFTTKTLYTELEPGTYHIVVQDAKGCEDEEFVTIDQPNQFNVEVEPTIEVKFGDSYDIQTQVNFPVDEIQQVSWYPPLNLSCVDCLDPTITPTTTMLYNVTVVTENGCKDSAPIMVIVNKTSGIYVPNAFSPNGDGPNDKFFIFSDPESVLRIKSFLVFDRWGETVYQYYNFQPNDPAYGWDGKHKGSKLDPAVFTWFADVEYKDGRTEIFSGDVVLMN